MQTSNVKMTFKCPVAWDGMQPREGGRFCDNCRIVVKDFTKVPIDELNVKLTACGEHACGQFELRQLQSPYGDWRDELLGFYQKRSVSTSGNYFLKQISLLLVMIMLVVAGCKPKMRLQGRYAWYDGGFNPRNMSAPPGVAEPIPSKVKRTTLPPVVVPAGRTMR